MKIYKSEIADGLESVLATNNTIACCAVAEKASHSLSFPELTADAEEQLKKLGVSKAENKDQFDLYYLQSILVSTGWNKNDDVFDPQELWDARNTPEDKPFNFMHDEKDIIGHITANDVVNFEGSAIAEGSEVPSTFNILTSAVIYTEWSDPEQRERMNKIVAEIEDGKWFVSMECLFPDFDYALANGEGEMRVVKRSEASAFLTKHLRSYGGTGKYENYKVGRLLRNLSFSGKGLVSKPANPRSIILEGNDLFNESQAQILTISSPKENDMSENLEKQIDDLRAELAEAKTASEVLKEKVVAEQHAEFAEKIQSLEATIAEQAEKLAEQTSANETLAESFKSQEETLATKDEEIKAKSEELAVMKREEAKMKRQAQLEEIGFDTEEATATVEEFDSVDDETFAKIVATMKKRADWPPWKKDKKEDEKEAEAGKTCKAEEALDEEQDSAEASEEVLENVEEVTEVAIAEAMGEDDPAENLRSVASEWLGSILQNKPQQ
tara:strand:- start:1913 stop:3406 length:1494 start_codon:yes stop_codon:yes gene_type:complete